MSYMIYMNKNKNYNLKVNIFRDYVQWSNVQMALSHPVFVHWSLLKFTEV